MQELQQTNDAFAGKLHARLGCFFASFEASKESLYCEMLRRMHRAGWKGAFVTLMLNMQKFTKEPDSMVVIY
jgi:hypothetical protein